MRLLKRPEVQSCTGLSRSAIYQKMQDGVFPKPVKTSSKAVAWVETEVEAWIADKIAARDTGNTSGALDLYTGMGFGSERTTLVFALESVASHASEQAV